MAGLRVAKIDPLDVLALIGLGLLSWGLWWIWPPLAPLVVGTLILVAVVYRARQVNVMKEDKGDGGKPRREVS